MVRVVALGLVLAACSAAPATLVPPEPPPPPCHTVEQGQPAGARIEVRGAAIPPLFIVQDPSQDPASAVRLDGTPTQQAARIPPSMARFFLVDAQRQSLWEVTLTAMGEQVAVIATPPAPAVFRRTGHNTGVTTASAALAAGLTVHLYVDVAIRVAECH
ncbi:MAG: hypothetical protein HY902_20040 [Deltaproteobacteria bacterium]|nr:hypothetical protein [Deltaproteobacteria bacterium]